MSRVPLRATAFLLAALAASPVPAEDDPRAVPLFNAGYPVGQVLETFKARGKAVVLVLQGGTTYSGKVKAVGTAAVVLTGLRGKEFYDAWIPLASIVAMEERVRMR